MDHPPWLIPPPSGGSFGRFTSPGRGSAETAFRLDSESQEDREGPQLTSSNRRSWGDVLRPPAFHPPGLVQTGSVPGTGRRQKGLVRPMSSRSRGANTSAVTSNQTYPEATPLGGLPSGIPRPGSSF